MGSLVTTSSMASYFPYLYRGIVKDNVDPENLGRCKIHIPGIYGIYDYNPSLLPYARPLTTGKIQIPEIDEVVWVIFEGGRKESPVYMIGTISTNNPVVNSDSDIIYQKDLCKIYYDKSKQALHLTVDKNEIKITPDMIEITGYAGGGEGGVGALYFDVVGVIDDD